MDNKRIPSSADIAEQVKNYCSLINASIQDWRRMVTRQIGDATNIEQMKAGVKADLDKLLVYLESLKIDSYEFSIGSNLAAQKLRNDISDFLTEKIEEFNNTDQEDGRKRNVAFVAYYIRAYIYRLHDPKNLNRFLDDYEHLFLKRYALAYQIRGRSYRAEGKVTQAITNDQLALEMLEKHNIDNIGVKVTYAASIAMALEMRETDIEQSQIERAVNDVIRAIEINRNYARYHFLLAKLKLYWTRNEVYSSMDAFMIDWEEKKKHWDDELKKADESIRRALNLLDEKSSSYVTFLVSYHLIEDRIKSLQTEIELFGNIYKQIQYSQEQGIKQFETLKTEIENTTNEMLVNALKKKEIEIDTSNNEKIKKFQEQVQNNLKKTQSEIKKKFSKEKKNIEASLRKNQIRYLEILAVFVAVVGVMVSSSDIMASNFSFIEALIGIIVMNAGILGVYTCFKMILSKESNKLYGSVLFVVCIIIIFLLIFSERITGGNPGWRIYEWIKK